MITVRSPYDGTELGRRTWRADQVPCGGVRARCNTKEGPPWAAREMTEGRLVVIDG